MFVFLMQKLWVSTKYITGKKLRRILKTSAEYKMSCVCLCYHITRSRCDGNNAAAGESQQLYEPVDLHGVQRPPTSSSDALLSRRHAAGASADHHQVNSVGADDVYIAGCAAAARVAAKTIRTVTAFSFCRLPKPRHLEFLVNICVTIDFLRQRGEVVIAISWEHSSLFSFGSAKKIQFRYLSRVQCKKTEGAK